jgi:ParB-like chromosome segregation protein Spo0J
MSLEVTTAKHFHITPNPWNPNVMEAEMFEKERASIREFGFIDPITVREYPGDNGYRYQIIDGEQRFRAGMAEGIEEFPIVILDVTEDEARELTIVLNDTRGHFAEDRLAELVRDLATRRERSRMEALLPYSKARLDQLTQRRTIDWDELDKRRAEVNKKVDRDTDPWVERVFRMPRASAEVLDEAIRKVQEQDGADQPWQALEMIAADFLAG